MVAGLAKGFFAGAIGDATGFRLESAVELNEGAWGAMSGAAAAVNGFTPWDSPIAPGIGKDFGAGVPPIVISLFVKILEWLAAAA
jgi:hypothetical protein